MMNWMRRWCDILPCISKPSLRQTTLLSRTSQRSSHTLPNLLFLQISTLPSTKLYSSWQLLISTRSASYLHRVVVWLVALRYRTTYSVSVPFSPARLLASLTSPSLHTVGLYHDHYSRISQTSYFMLIIRSSQYGCVTSWGGWYENYIYRKPVMQHEWWIISGVEDTLAITEKQNRSYLAKIEFNIP